MGLQLDGEKEYTIILPGEELAAIINKVAELPYSTISTSMIKITEQINQQNNDTARDISETV